MEYLYHATTPDNLLSILNDDSIKFTFATDFERHYDATGRNFFLSTSRSKYGGYALRSGKNATLVLSGRAIQNSRDIKIDKVDYYGYEWWKHNTNNNETEERILSHQRDNLSPLKKYVAAIVVNFPLNMYITHDYKNTFIANMIHRIYLPLAKKAKQIDIPVYFFCDINDSKATEYYKMHRFEKAMNADAFIDLLNKISIDNNYTIGADEKPYAGRSWFTEMDLTHMETLIDIMDNSAKYNNKPYDSFSKDEHYVIDYIINYQRELYDHFANLIHNLKADHPEFLKKLATSIYKHKCKTFKEYITKLKNKELYIDYENQIKYLKIKNINL